MPNPKVQTDLTADNSDLNRKIKESEGAVDGFKDKAEKGTASTADGFKKSIGAVTSFVGAITAAIGVAGVMFTLGQSLRKVWDDFFTSGTEKARDFANALGTDARQNVAKTTEEIDRLNAQIGRNSAGGFGALINTLRGESTSVLQEQVRELEGIARSNAQQVRAQEERKRDAIRATEAERQRLEAETQQKAGLAQEKADEEEAQRQREAAEQQQRDWLKLRDEQEKADADRLDAAIKIGEAMSAPLLAAVDALLKANQQIIAQQSQMITSVGTLVAAIAATEAAGDSGGPGNSWENA